MVADQNRAKFCLKRQHIYKTTYQTKIILKCYFRQADSQVCDEI